MTAKKGGGVDYGALVTKNRQTMQRQAAGVSKPEAKPGAQNSAEHAAPDTGKAEPVNTVNNVHIESIDYNLDTKTAGRQRKTVAEPGARQGLQAGWTRATMIVREDLLDILKDYAYTERLTLKEVLNDALSAYVDGIDKAKLIHRKH